MITERQIREHITTRAARFFQHHRDVLFVEELEVDKGQARIDIAFIGAHLVGVEIKSPQDNLSRLPSQSEAFSRYFEYVMLVADHGFIPEAEKIVPNWWGLASIQIMDQRVRFRQVRRPKQNPSMDIAAFVQLLWKEELVSLVHQLLGTRPSIRSPKRELRNMLMSLPDTDLLLRRAVELMTRRTDWRATPLSAAAA